MKFIALLLLLFGYHLLAQPFMRHADRSLNGGHIYVKSISPIVHIEPSSRAIVEGQFTCY